MPRPRTQDRTQIIARAMEQFWQHGFAASSMDDLVKATGSTRHTIYTEFCGKERLFEDCLVAYSGAIVTPAFAQVETPAARTVGRGLGHGVGHQALSLIHI